jgi:mannan endo-1,4-beta-mannosidase
MALIRYHGLYLGEDICSTGPAMVFRKLALITAFLVASSAYASPSFVRVKGQEFERDGRPYTFLGTNFWQAMNLGSEGEGGDRKLLVRELDRLNKLGIRQLRILGLSEGPNTEPYRVVPAVENTPGVFDEKVLAGLDFLLSEMGKRGMTAVVCLGNFWPWSGGMAQRVSWVDGSTIPYPPPHPGGSWEVFQDYASRFYTMESAVRAQHESVKKIVTRRNSITKGLYADDPTIMAWELANEPRGGSHRAEFLKWVSTSAKLIKALDRNHLVTLGSEGETPNPKKSGNGFVEDHSFPEIDYTTFHIWTENWGIFNPKKSSLTYSFAMKIARSYIRDHVEKSKSLGKPVVLEEFGLARDRRAMDPKSSTWIRSQYFQDIFSEVLKTRKDSPNLVGVNFWAWSGESRPTFPYGGLWKVGDSLLGDPPHEEQGWYGVYDTDVESLDVIRSFTPKFETGRRLRSLRHRNDRK